MQDSKFSTPWLTAEKAAAFLDISVDELRRKCRCGTGPKSYAPTPRRTRWHILDLTRWQAGRAPAPVEALECWPHLFEGVIE